MKPMEDRTEPWQELRKSLCCVFVGVMTIFIARSRLIIDTSSMFFQGNCWPLVANWTLSVAPASRPACACRAGAPARGGPWRSGFTPACAVIDDTRRACIIRSHQLTLAANWLLSINLLAKFVLISNVRMLHANWDYLLGARLLNFLLLHKYRHIFWVENTRTHCL